MNQTIWGTSGLRYINGELDREMARIPDFRTVELRLDGVFAGAYGLAFKTVRMGAHRIQAIQRIFLSVLVDLDESFNPDEYWILRHEGAIVAGAQARPLHWEVVDLEGLIHPFSSGCCPGDVFTSSPWGISSASRGMSGRFSAYCWCAQCHGTAHAGPCHGWL